MDLATAGVYTVFVWFTTALAAVQCQAVFGSFFTSAGRGSVAIVACFAATVLVACQPDEAEPIDDGRCTVPVWGIAERPGERLSVVGSWNDWAEPTAMSDAGDGAWQLAQLRLSPGVFEYLVVEEGQGRIDAYNPLTAFRAADGLEVSRAVVPDCTQPQLSVVAVHEDRPDGFAVEVTWTPAVDGVPVEPTAIVGRLSDGTPLAIEAVDEDEGSLHLVARGQARGKHRVTIEASDAQGRTAEPVTAVGWVEPVAPQWSDGIVYQIMIDRYRAEGGVALDPPPNAGARAGGTLDGIYDELVAGTYESLGVSALWLSPVYLNPIEAREGRDDDHLYEGYHGYWPLDTRAVDPRIGGEAALTRLVDEAHQRGIRVLLDLVPNHLYEDNPRVAANRGQGWFHEHEPECICGSPDCSWNEFIQVCWFTPYLPDLRFQHPDALQSVVDDALWWHDTFDTDGFRIDAVPMMPRAVSRRIVHAVRDATGPRSAAFSMGEIFTGPGAGGTEIIRYHLGPDGLDSAFDFPLMWEIRNVLAHRSRGFSAIEASLANTDRALDGSGAVLATMIGNHDVTRFVSEAQGNAGQDPWGAPPPAPTDPIVYEHAALALGLVLTLPGLPVLYYGDEVGLAGAADPDNRRVMPVTDALPTAQVELLDHVRTMAQLRRCMPALRRGDRRAVVVAGDHYAFVRDAGDGAPAIIVLSRADEASAVALPSGTTASPGWYKDALSGQRFEVSSLGASIEMEPRSMRVLIPEQFPCG